VFISTVSKEFENAGAPFEGLRSRLRHYLAAAGCDVKVQEDFRQTSRGTLEKLDEYIRGCDAVIHLVGTLPGHLADADSRLDVPDYLAHIRNQPGGRSFLDLQPALLPLFGDGSRISLTQFEAYMALHHQVPLFVYATPDGRGAQAEHLRRLQQGRPARHASSFENEAGLLGQLIGDLREIVSGLGISVEDLNRKDLLEVLSKLSRPMFEEVLFNFDHNGQIPGGEVSQRQRAMALIQLAEGRGDGMPSLVQIVKGVRAS
jgi:hypothetical protein